MNPKQRRSVDTLLSTMKPKKEPKNFITRAIEAKIKQWQKRLPMKKVDVPVGKAWPWEVAHFIVDKPGMRMHNLCTGIQMAQHRIHEPRPIIEGEYTKLVCGNTIVMSDTPSEMEDHLNFLHLAKDHVLINGLGLGMVAQACLEMKEVTHVTVIEKSSQVIDLVAEHYMKRFGDKLNIIHANAFKYKPPKGVKYGAVWHDVWDNISTDNISGMQELCRKYARRCAWQGCWCELECRLG
jgi:hypothetical protein